MAVLASAVGAVVGLVQVQRACEPQTASQCVENWVAWFASRQDAQNLDESIKTYIVSDYFQDREKFAPVVDYYDKGPVDPSVIARDKKNFAEKWPVRNYSLLPGSVQIRKADRPNEYVVTFGYTFSLRNGGEHKEGQARDQLQLRQENGTYLITGVKQPVSP
jgi:hypothetical protein